MASTIWKGYITFGLVSLPVKLVAAARSEAISFNQLHRTDHSRVKQALYCIAEDKPVPRSELIKGYEYEKDRYVVVEDEDIKKIQPKTAKVMEILEFVKADETDPIILESSYYIQPDDAGEKPYTLLFEAMRRSGYNAVAKLTMHNREHIVILRPGKFGMLLHTMYYRDEIRAMDEFRTNPELLTDKELVMAQTLIDALAANFDHNRYQDTYRETLRGMIDAKIAGKEVVAAPQEQELAPVIDIMEALKSSLAALKKPPTVEVSAKAEPTDIGEAKRKTRTRAAR